MFMYCLNLDKSILQLYILIQNALQTHNSQDWIIYALLTLNFGRQYGLLLIFMWNRFSPFDFIKNALFCQFKDKINILACMRLFIFQEHFILSLKSSFAGPTTVSRWANHWVIGATTFLQQLLFWLLDPLCLLTGQSLSDQCYSHSQTKSKPK